MKHVGTQRIESDRLILRRFEPGDAESIYGNWANDDKVTVHLTWPTHKTVETSEKVLGFWLDSYNDISTYNWGIELKTSGELIGSIGVVNIDETNESCEMGYCIGRKYWGQGITSEALRFLIDFLFENVEPERIFALHHSDNPASGEVMRKAGMEHEGKLRSYRKKTNGKFVDCDFYSILRTDYMNR